MVPRIAGRAMPGPTSAHRRIIWALAWVVVVGIKGFGYTPPDKPKSTGDALA